MVFKAKDGRVLKKHDRPFFCESKNALVHIFALIFNKLFPCDGSERKRYKKKECLPISGSTPSWLNYVWS